MDDHWDAQGEIKRLEKEIKKTKEDLEWKAKKLQDSAFLQKAPASLVEKVKEECHQLELKWKELQASLDRLRQ